METVKLEVVVGKETNDLVQGIVGLIRDGKKALENGYQADQDIPALLMSGVNNLIPAIEGMSQIDDEMAESKKAFMISMGIMAGELWDLFVPAKELPELPESPESV